MRKNQESCYYPEYLKLDLLLAAQDPASAKHGKPAHDETLFIIVHQVYELWFKQILHELNSLIKMFKQNPVPEGSLGTAVSRVYRINSIINVLIDQFHVLETMTPQDFLDFRDYLVPASGFQSIQFREIEIRLGLKKQFRHKFDQTSFYNRLQKEDQDYLLKIESEPSLYDLMEQWLERLPFLEVGEFKFWQEYQQAVDSMLKSDTQIIKDLPNMPDEDKQNQYKELELTRKTFESLFNKELFEQLRNDGKRRLSQKATLAALFIKLYSGESLLNLPNQFLRAIIDLDENLSSWRYRHALLAHRMLGTKIGTGGSAGHQYLKATTTANRIFTDLFNLSTFLIPKSSLPKLPDPIRKNLNFQY